MMMEQQNKSEYEAMLGQIMIAESPKLSLADCLNCYSEKQIREIGVNYGLEASDTAELCVRLADIIKEAYSAYLEQRELDRTESLLNLQGKDLALEDMKNLALVREFMEERYDGQVFFFMDSQRGTFSIGLPEELVQIALDFFNDEKRVKQVRLKQNVRKTALALVNIYGLCEKTQFYKVWESLFDEELKEEMGEQLLEQAAAETDYFEIHPDCLIMKGMNDKHALQMIREIVEELPYYMPTLEDLDAYHYESVDFHSPYYIELEEYVVSKVPDTGQAKNAMFELGMCAASDIPCDKVVQVATALGITFGSVREANGFAALYYRFSNNSPSWMLRGYTPEAAGTVEEFKPLMSMPGEEVPKKVGRNELCPCGSGKKYKHCCGR